jgi:3-oxoacyl-[acyl-carrier-protein] synthase-3
MTKLRAAITGVGGYVPDYILTNKELETLVDTNDEWILSRTGIRERRILKGEGKGTSHMGEKAINELLKKTNTDPLDIDLIICCTTTPDFVFPATGNLLCDMVGAKNAFSYDLQAACSGFIFGLVTGSQFIETGKYKKVIVVGADKMSSIINYKDRTTCIIFGDGAGAVLLEPDTQGFGVMDSILKVDGSGAQYLGQKAGGSRKPPSHESIDANEHYAYQEGATVFKFAVKNMADVSAEIM